MKFLIILALIVSCGKKNPAQPMLDVSDSDGDFIVNELDKDKYIADFTPEEEVRANLRFYSVNNSESFYSVPLTNRHFNEKDAVNLLTKSKELLVEEDYFYESEKMKILSDSIEKMNLSEPFYDLEIQAINGFSPKKFILMKKNKELNTFSMDQSMNFTKEEVENLLNKSTYLKVKSPSEELKKSIRSKTYRVFFSSGGLNKIFYVSKELEFKSFLKQKNIYDYVNIDLINLNEDDSKVSPRWFIRSIGSDYVVYEGSQNKILEIQQELTSKVSEILKRENGVGKKSLEIQKHLHAKVKLRLKAEKRVRHIEEMRQVTSRRSGNITIPCVTVRRDIKQEVTKTVELEELFDSFRIIADGLPVLFDSSTIALTHKDGFTELSLNIKAQHLVLKLVELDESSFTTTGVISSSCRNTDQKRVNEESFLKIDAEAYVEIAD